MYEQLNPYLHSLTVFGVQQARAEFAVNIAWGKCLTTMINWTEEKWQTQNSWFIVSIVLFMSHWLRDVEQHQRRKMPTWNPTIIIWFEIWESRVQSKLQGLASKRTCASSAGIKFYWIKISFAFMASLSWEFQRCFETWIRSWACFLSHVKIDYCFQLGDEDYSALLFCFGFGWRENGSRTSSMKFSTRHRILFCCANIFIATRALAMPVYIGSR